MSNGSNINDLFSGFTFPAPLYILEIYNKCGELVCKGDQDWDGKFNGQNVAVVVYPIIFETTFGCEFKFIGDLMSVR